MLASLSHKRSAFGGVIQFVRTPTPSQRQNVAHLVHVAELATGPKFNQIATAVITVMIATKITTLMANLRAVMLGFLSSPQRAFSCAS